MERLAALFVATKHYELATASAQCVLLLQPRGIILVLHNTLEKFELLGRRLLLLGRQLPVNQEILYREGLSRLLSREQLRDHHRLVALFLHRIKTSKAGDTDVRKDCPDTGQQCLWRPFVFISVTDDTSNSIWRAHSLVWPPLVVYCLGGSVGAKAVSVQNRDVIKVEVAVVGNFPVRPPEHPIIEKVPILKTELRQHFVIATKKTLYGQAR